MKLIAFYFTIFFSLSLSAQVKWPLEAESFIDPEIYKLSFDQLKGRLENSEKLVLSSRWGTYVDSTNTTKLFPKARLWQVWYNQEGIYSFSYSFHLLN